MSGVFITYEYKLLKYEFLKTVLPIKTIYIFNNKIFKMVGWWILTLIIVWLNFVYNKLTQKKMKSRGDRRDAIEIYKDGSGWTLRKGDGTKEQLKIINENWQKFYVDSSWQKYTKTF